MLYANVIPRDLAEKPFVDVSDPPFKLPLPSQKTKEKCADKKHLAVVDAE